ncbi:MAG: nucleotidyltransferase family protein [Gemmatimonadaceae bacterium]
MTITVGGRQASRVDLRRHAVALLRLTLGYDLRASDRCAWEGVFRMAARERCAALAWLRSRETISRLAPARVVAAWRREVVRASEHGCRQLGRYAVFLHRLDDAGAEPVVLKGMPLSQRLYSDPFVRLAHDLDVVVRPDRRDIARSIAVELGWRRVAGTAPFEENFAWHDERERMWIDLHSSALSDRLSHLHLPLPEHAPCAIHGFSFRAHSGPLMPGTLAAHLAKHELPPFLWLIDFATLWSLIGHDGRNASRRAASQAGLGRYLEWAQVMAAGVAAAAEDDPGALGALGIEPGLRRDRNGIWRDLRFAVSAGDAMAVLGDWIWPRGERTTLRALPRSAASRLRARAGSLLMTAEKYGAPSPMPHWNDPIRPDRHGERERWIV